MLTGKTSKMFVAAVSVGLWTGTQAFAGDRDGSRRAGGRDVSASVTYTVHNNVTRITTRRVHIPAVQPQVYYRANSPQGHVYYSATDRYPARSTQFYSTHNPRHGQGYGWHRPQPQRHRGHFRSQWGHRSHGRHHSHYPPRCAPTSGVTIHIEF